VLQAALDRVGPEDGIDRALLLTWLAQEYYWVDPMGRCLELHEQAIEMARRLGDDRTLAFTLDHRGLALIVFLATIALTGGAVTFGVGTTLTTTGNVTVTGGTGVGGPCPGCWDY